MGSRSGTWWLALGAALMLLGVALHLLESHEHEHVHEGLAREHAQDTELMMAGSVVTVLPVLALFLLLQRYYLDGLMAGSVKG